MLLSKLKVIPAVVLALVVSAGAVGVTYRAVAAEPGPARAGARADQDDLEALRLEVEALRKEVRATRERVKALETGMQALGGAEGAARRARERLELKPAPADDRVSGQLFKFLLTEAAQTPSDPVTQAEAALKKLRANPGDKQAAEALERATQRLKERAKSQPPAGAPQKP